MANTKMQNLPPNITGQGLMVRTQEDLHSMVHAAFTPDRFNVLVPKALNFGPGIKVAIQMVELDADIDQDSKRSKDFWTIDNKEFIISANGIRKIASAANIRWDPEQCRVEDAHYNEKNELVRLRYKAVCRVITSLGNTKIGIGTYEYNYANDLKDARFREKEKKGNKWVATDRVKWNQVNQRRQFAVQLAESGAKARAIYDALGILERTFKKEDISKPFIIPQAIDDIDYNDPEIRRMAAARSLGIQDELYGSGRRAIKAEYEVNGEGVPNGNSQSPPAEPAEPVSEEPADGPPEEGKKPEPTSAELRAMFEDEWRNSDSNQRADKIRQLAGKLRVDITGKSQGKDYSPPEEWKIDVQIKWLIGLAEQAGEIPKMEG